MKSIVLLCLLVFTLIVAGCSDINSSSKNLKSGQYAKIFEQEIAVKAKLGYLVYIPKEFPSSKDKWPLVMFLHGVGERGSDLERVKIHGLAKLAENKDFPFMVVSPQCPGDVWWNNPVQVEALNALLDELMKTYPVDPDRVYLTGLSMGGFGTWALAAAHPEKFAAIAPICGGGNPADAKKLASLPIWVFHGDNDTTVPISKSQEMVDAIKKEGGDIKFTVYPGVGHDSWTRTYDNPELYEWLLKYTR